MEQIQFVTLLRANNSGGAYLRGICSGEKEVSEVAVVQEADKNNWDVDGVVTATKAEKSHV